MPQSGHFERPAPKAGLNREEHAWQRISPSRGPSIILFVFNSQIPLIFKAELLCVFGL